VQPHPIDPISAASGLLAVVLGVLVASRSFGGFDDVGGWWVAAAAAVVGVALLPWNARRGAARDGAQEPEPEEDPVSG
jgi:hypothetical protein